MRGTKRRARLTTILRLALGALSSSSKTVVRQLVFPRTLVFRNGEPATSLYW